MFNPHQLTVNINITLLQLKRALAVIFFLNIFILFGTWFHKSGMLKNGNSGLRRLVAQFNLGTENVIAAWYSSMLLLLVAVAAFFCFLYDKGGNTKLTYRIINWGWIPVVLIFLLLSFDEMGSFHEMIGESAGFKKMLLAKDGGGGWYAFFILIGLVALFMITFFAVKFKGKIPSLILSILGVLLLVSNPFQEKYEMYSWHSAPDPDTWKRPVFYLLLEEGSEIFATFCFLCSFVLYPVKSIINKGNQPSDERYQLELIVPKRLLLDPGTLIVIAGMVMLIVKINTWEFESDSGIPQNWFPSAMSFIVSILGFYYYLNARDKYNSNNAVTLLIAFLSIIISIFFGANLYVYTGGLVGKIPVVLLSVSILAGIFSFIKWKSKSGRFFVGAWLVSIFISLNAKGFSSPLFGYLASSCLLLALIIHYQQMAGKLNRDY